MNVVKKVTVPIIKKVKKVVTKAMRAIAAKKRLDMWRDFGSHGIKYGAVRDFMIDNGVIWLFNKGLIVNTVATAIPLIEKLVGMNVIERGDGAKNITAMHHLMWSFYKYAGINGYEWKNSDYVSQAGFAQCFLEYLCFKVLPQWNKVEQLLSNDITFKTDKTKKEMKTGIETLLAILSGPGLFQFMKEHLRFPNMRVNLIDYSNANQYPGAKEKLDKYRESMGIPTP